MTSRRNLFVKEKKENPTRIPPRLFGAMRVLGFISLPFFPLMCLFVMDYMNCGKLEKLLTFVSEHPMSLAFEVLTVEVLFLALLLLFGSGAAAGGVFGALSLIFAYVNYTKTALNGDHFHPRDITMAGSLEGLGGFISGHVPVWFVLGAAVIVLWVVFLALSRANLPLKILGRLPLLLVLCLCLGLGFGTMERSARVLEVFGMSFMDAALQSSNYRANGFVGAFTINTLMMNISEPEGYSRELIEGLLSGCEAVPRAEGAPLYDVIVVLSESFFDVRSLPGTEFSANPLENFGRIIKLPGAYSGKMYSSASGGGTVRPEFEILTGLSADYLYDVASPYELVSGTVESYVQNYARAGYYTAAVHPYIRSFYSRDSAYPFLGFADFFAREEVCSMTEPRYRRGLVTDDTTLRAMEKVLEEHPEPVFLLAMTMECHQPYTPQPDDENPITVTNSALDEATLGLVTVYANGLAEADRMLGDLVDYIDSRQRPTVLLFFGDHIPSLGAGQAAYRQSGAIGGGMDYWLEQEYLYSAPFIIYTNTGAETDLLKKEDNKVSSYYLLDIIADMTGFEKTRYMSLLEELYGQIPYYNLRLELPANPVRDRLGRIHRYITYDRLLGKKWSVSADGK
ncbi:MAG: LTA synthase family protein [Oscillospiraceae bacterium]|nr:LTA synthase family protein [Oscillospiraceae bacterium]